MQYKKTIVLLITLALLAACKQQAAADVAASSTPDTSVTTQNQMDQPVATELSAQQKLEKKLTKKMPYAELRKTVLAEGWLPLVTSECKENVGGDAAICDQQPEVESCSGDGHCNMKFAHGENVFRVGTFADYTKFWEFSVVEKSDSAIVNEGKEASGAVSLAVDACTQKGYWSFFESFVKSEAIRKSHTSPKVVVSSYSGNAKVEGKYKQFKIGLFDSSWIYVDPATKSSNVQRLDLKDELIGNTFRVTYQKVDFGPDEELVKTIGAPGAYVFELQNGCWRLTQELR